MLLIALVLSFLALSAQVVQAAFKFNFSPIHQCQPVSIAFSGLDSNDPIPTALLLLPFNSTPFSIPIANADASSTGVNVSFFPIPTNTEFIASLDDTSGDNAAKVSDVFRVLESPTGDTSCLPPAPQSVPFTLPTSVAQCDSFTVSHQGDIAPTVRVFSPKGGSFLMDPVLQAPDGNIYKMNVTRGTQILLMAFPPDEPGSGFTSQLMTVGGDASSDKSCFTPPASKTSDTSSSSNLPTSGSSTRESRGLIIGLSAGGGTVALVAVIMVLYLVRQRRKERRRVKNIGFNPTLLQRQSSFEKFDYGAQYPDYTLEYGQANNQNLTRPEESPRYSYGPEYVKDPPYTNERYSATQSDGQRTLSWASSNPPLQRTISQKVNGNAINPYDIEKMLDVAAGERSSFRTPSSEEPPTASSENEQEAPTRTLMTPSPRPTPARGHLKAPSDVPVDPSSMTFSTMLGENGIVYDSLKTLNSARSSNTSYAASSNFEILTRPSNAYLLPVSSLRQQFPTSSRFSDISSLDSSGIGGFPRPAFARESITPNDTDSVDSWGNVTGIAR